MFAFEIYEEIPNKLELRQQFSQLLLFFEFLGLDLCIL